MRVLVGCEYSGRVRNAFRDKGVEAWSCDLLPSDDCSPYHLQGDVFQFVAMGFDLAIFHPPCTYLTASAEWCYRDTQNKAMSPGVLYGTERRQAREAAIAFVVKLSELPIHYIAIENPVGVLSSRWRKPDQFIQPYAFGEDASKKTCLWLKNLPLLRPTSYVEPRLVQASNGILRPRWGNQTDSGQNKEPPSKDRWKTRSTTWQGWADAMAEQWGGLLPPTT